MAKASKHPEMERRLASALEERDSALSQLAAVKSELEALRLAVRRHGESEPKPYPAGTSAALKPPLRYVMVDAANDALKRWLGPLHSLHSLHSLLRRDDDGRHP